MEQRESEHNDGDKGTQTYVVFVCPECGEQIHDTEYDTERGTVRGHYHDPPEGWLNEDGKNPHGTGEDPWFDAIEIRVVVLDAVVEFLPVAGDFHCGSCGTLLDGGTDEPVAARELRAEVARLREALREIADQGPELTPGWKHWREIARGVLEGSSEAPRP